LNLIHPALKDVRHTPTGKRLGVRIADFEKHGWHVGDKTAPAVPVEDSSLNPAAENAVTLYGHNPPASDSFGINRLKGGIHGLPGVPTGSTITSWRPAPSGPPQTLISADDLIKKSTGK
jgi:hypothetical protein